MDVMTRVMAAKLKGSEIVGMPRKVRIVFIRNSISQAAEDG
jgi:hypothetical protein